MVLIHIIRAKSIYYCIIYIPTYTPTDEYIGLQNACYMNECFITRLCNAINLPKKHLPVSTILIVKWIERARKI